MGALHASARFTGTGARHAPSGVLHASATISGRSRPTGVLHASSSFRGTARATRGTLHASATFRGTPPTTQVWPNGYTWQYEIRMKAQPGGGVVTNWLLPFGMTKAEWGSRAQSASGWDIRFEMNGKLGHLLLNFNATTGNIAALVNIPSRDFEVDESLFLYIGKAGLGASEESAANARAGGWLFFHTGGSTTDFSGQGLTFTVFPSITADTIGDWPAGLYNGTSSYMARTSSEMNGLARLTYFALVRAAESGRAMEILNVAPADVADLSLRVTIEAKWFQVFNAGNVRSSLQTVQGLFSEAQDHAVSGAWSTGSAPDLVVDGEMATLETTPGVATGVTAISEALELGRGDRPPGTASYWNGKIGPVFAVNRRLPLEARRAITMALNRPLTVFGVGEGNLTNVANRSPVAMPFFGTADADVESLFPVAAQSYDQNGDTLTPGLPSPVTTGVARLVGTQIGYKPASGTDGQTHSFPYTVHDALKVSTGMITVEVNAETSDSLPAGYPTPPAFSGALTAIVSNGSELQAEIDSTSTSGSGKIITCDDGVDYGTITINRGQANIKIVCNNPRFSSLITARGATRRDGTATIDQTNLIRTSNTDTIIEDHCVPGGFRAHSACARMNLNVTRCGILWVEGFDFPNPRRFMVNRTSSATQGCDQLWIRKCSFNESDTNLIGVGGVSGRGADLFVSWENYLFGDGTRADPGTSGSATGGVWTDYGLQFYNCGPQYVYKTIFDGGFNHMISQKMEARDIFVDDCLFTAYHPNTSVTSVFEMGQEGSPTGNDRTCGLVTVRGCTFTAGNVGGELRCVFVKDTEGVVFRNNMIYPGYDVFFRATPAPAPGRNGPNDQGIMSGARGMLIENNTFRGSTVGSTGQPGVCIVANMYTDSGGGYTFTAKNNSYSATRAVSQKGSRVTTNLAGQPNPGFTG